MTDYYAIVDLKGTPYNVLVAAGGADLRSFNRTTGEWELRGSLLSYFMGTASGDIEEIDETEALTLARQFGASGLP